MNVNEKLAQEELDRKRAEAKADRDWGFGRGTASADQSMEQR